MRQIPRRKLHAADIFRNFRRMRSMSANQAGRSAARENRGVLCSLLKRGSHTRVKSFKYWPMPVTPLDTRVSGKPRYGRSNKGHIVVGNRVTRASRAEESQDGERVDAPYARRYFISYDATRLRIRNDTLHTYADSIFNNSDVFIILYSSAFDSTIRANTIPTCVFLKSV